MTEVTVSFYHSEDRGDCLLFEAEMPFVPRLGEHISIPYDFPDGTAHMQLEVTDVEWCLDYAVRGQRRLFLVTIGLKPIGYSDPCKGGLVPMEDLNESELVALRPDRDWSDHAERLMREKP